MPGEPKCGKGTTLGQPKPETVSDGDRRRERAVADDFQPSPIARKLVSLARTSQTRYENAAAELPAPEEDKKALAAVENEKLWREALQQACGTCDFDVQVRILHHLLKANGHEPEGAWEAKKGLVGMLHEIAPRDIQGAFAAIQLIAVQENVVALLARASVGAYRLTRRKYVRIPPLSCLECR